MIGSVKKALWYLMLSIEVLILWIDAISFSLYFLHTNNLQKPEAEERPDYVHYAQIPKAIVETIKAKEANYSLQVAKLISVNDQPQLRQFASGALWYSILAWVNLHLTQPEILEYFANRSYLGRGCYGIVCAAKTCFNKPLDALTQNEIDLLLLLFKAPSRYSDKCPTPYVITE